MARSSKFAITKDKKKSSIVIDNVIERFVLTDDETEEGVKKVKIDEETLFRSYYTETFSQIVQNCRKLFSDFKQNKQFHAIMRYLKDNPKFHKKRYLNILSKSGGSQDYYSKNIYEELETRYTKKK